MPKRDAFAAISVDELRALGNDVIPVLVNAIEERADAKDVSFVTMAKKLPEGWRQLMLAGHVIEAIEENDSFAGAFFDLRRARDIHMLEVFFRELGCRVMADALRDAREHTSALVDEDADPLDIEELRDITPDDLDLARARAAITACAKQMTTPFPAM
jgi:hypothetical protein